MFVLVCAALLFSVRGADAETGASVWGRTTCLFGYCITLPEGQITAEVGLCAVIPCSFTAVSGFRLSNIVWYKCEPTKERCGDADIIFHSNPYSRKVQAGFKGRVSLLESDFSQNCSIIISDLKESDSGKYQLRVNSLQSGYSLTFPPKATVSVKGLSQRPTVVIPPLTAGRPATLTCTAPGLCFGSAPTFTWRWRGRGKNDSHGSITHLMTENVAAFAKRSSSSLFFDPSAEHHGTNVTCTVIFTENVSTEETATLSVTYMKEVRVTENATVREGDTVNLTCSIESFPPALITWTKVFDQSRNGTGTTLKNDSDLLTDTAQRGTATLSISNVTAEDSGQYICTVTHMNSTWKENVNVTVIYMRDPVISGDLTVKEGDVLNLTCSSDSFPPSLIVWTKRGFDTGLSNGSNLQNDTGSSTLVVLNMTAEHSGHYICTAQHLDRTGAAVADVVMTWSPRILKSSGCEDQSGVLICVCISQGSPLPAIKWPLLKDHTEYSIITKVSNYTVNSTVILNRQSYSSVECVSDNGKEEAKEKLTTRAMIPSEPGVPPTELFQRFIWLELIIAFFIGVLLSAGVFFLAKRCHGKTQKSHDNLDETLEMGINQEDSLIYNGQTANDAQTHGREKAEAGSVPEETRTLCDLPNDVEYANINFSLLKRKSPRDAAKKQETTQTEYAEVKKQVKEEREDGGAEEGEVLGEAGLEEDVTNHCVPEEEEEERDMGVYSTVKELMAEM